MSRPCVVSWIVGRESLQGFLRLVELSELPGAGWRVGLGGSEGYEAEMIEQPKIQYGPKGKRAKILEEYVLPVNKKWDDGTGRLWYVGTVRIPKGFVTDFASTFPFHWLIPPQGRYSPAAVGHDYLFYTGHFPRPIADHVFNELMKRCHVSGWKRRTMYRMVRLFGGGAWKKHRKGLHPHGEGS